MKFFFFLRSYVTGCFLFVQFFTPLTVEAPGGALRTPARACLTRAQQRRWRSVNYEVMREHGGERVGGGDLINKNLYFGGKNCFVLQYFIICF